MQERISTPSKSEVLRFVVKSAIVAESLYVLSLLAFRIGFTKEQRDAIVQRDIEFGAKIKGNKGGCQATWKHHCNGDKQVNVHHRLPVGYCSRLGIDPNRYPTNGVTLCENAHVGDNGIHPDVAEAKRNYAKDRKSFDKMTKVRSDKLDERVIYWNDEHGRVLEALAIRATQKAEDSGKWKWPSAKRK